LSYCHRRWVVERSFAWLGNSKRLFKNYERLTDKAEVFIKITGYTVFYAEFVRFLNSFLDYLSAESGRTLAFAKDRLRPRLMTWTPLFPINSLGAL
jgi:hypothetical protein